MSETMAKQNNKEENQNVNKAPLTLVVITKNEEDNIDMCLGSAYGWADEILVVDDESTDRTIELCEKYADKIHHRRMDNEGRHRNWAYAQATNEWVLSLDADEYVTEELKAEISEALKSDEHQAYSIPLRNFIGHYWVQYAGWYPAGKTRLFQKSKFKYEEVEVHPRIYLEGTCGHLTKDIVHEGYPDIEHFLGSLNRQTTLEARKWIQTGRKMSLGRATWRTLDRFPRSFLRKKGFKDGFYGFVVGFMASLYQIMSYMKYIEMQRKTEAERK